MILTARYILIRYLALKRIAEKKQRSQLLTEPTYPFDVERMRLVVTPP